MSEQSVAIPHLHFVWEIIKKLGQEICSIKLTGIKVFTISAMGLLFIPQIARLPACYSFYPACVFAYYVSWYGCVLEGTHMLFRFIEWHRLFFCCV